MKAIVIGGAGFVGSHVADALTAAGHGVTIFDQRASEYLQPGQTFVQGDILDAQALRHAVAGHDVVMHFAGLADLNRARTDAEATARLNVVGTVNVLEAARLANVRRFVFASTIYVYSQAGGFYRASKQACELYVEEYQRCYGLNYSVLRFGTLYGRRADQTNSVYRYLHQALSERRIVAEGTGQEIREYIHVEDAARATVQVLGDDFKNQSVILTGHHPMRFHDLLAMIREIVGQDVQVDLRPLSGAASLAAAHYEVTPYSFRPKLGRKLVSHYYVDMGQGLLDCLDEISGTLASPTRGPLA